MIRLHGGDVRCYNNTDRVSCSNFSGLESLIVKEESSHRGWQTVCVVRWQTSEKFEWNTRQRFSSVCCCSFCLIGRPLTVTLSATPNERATTFRIAVSWSTTPPRDYAAITRYGAKCKWTEIYDYTLFFIDCPTSGLATVLVAESPFWELISTVIEPLRCNWWCMEMKWNHYKTVDYQECIANESLFWYSCLYKFSSAYIENIRPVQNLSAPKFVTFGFDFCRHNFKLPLFLKICKDSMRFNKL